MKPSLSSLLALLVPLICFAAPAFSGGKPEVRAATIEGVEVKIKKTSDRFVAAIEDKKKLYEERDMWTVSVKGKTVGKVLCNPEGYTQADGCGEMRASYKDGAGEQEKKFNDLDRALAWVVARHKAATGPWEPEGWTGLDGGRHFTLSLPLSAKVDKSIQADFMADNPAPAGGAAIAKPGDADWNTATIIIMDGVVNELTPITVAVHDKPPMSFADAERSFRNMAGAWGIKPTSTNRNYVHGGGYRGYEFHGLFNNRFKSRLIVLYDGGKQYLISYMVDKKAEGRYEKVLNDIVNSLRLL